MKYVIVIVLFVSIGLLIYGFSINEEQVVFGQKCIGFGTVGIFFIAMPLFLIRVSKGKKMKDYLLNEENIRKMQGKKMEESNNQ